VSNYECGCGFEASFLEACMKYKLSFDNNHLPHIYCPKCKNLIGLTYEKY